VHFTAQQHHDQKVKLTNDKCMFTWYGLQIRISGGRQAWAVFSLLLIFLVKKVTKNQGCIKNI